MLPCWFVFALCLIVFVCCVCCLPFFFVCFMFSLCLFPFMFVCFCLCGFALLLYLFMGCVSCVLLFCCLWFSKTKMHCEVCLFELCLVFSGCLLFVCLFAFVLYSVVICLFRLLLVCFCFPRFLCFNLLCWLSCCSCFGCV